MGSFANVFSLYNPHPVDPVRSIGEGMSLRNAMQLNQERAAQADRLRIQNQQIQRNMDAQKAVASAISGATKQGEDGGYSTDWDAVDRALTDQGWGREAISMRKERREEMQAAYKALGEQMDASKKTLELTGQLLGAHPRVDWGLRDKDPIGFDTQLQQAKIGFGGLLAKGVSMKILSPQEAQQYAQLPYTPQLEQYLDTMANGALSRIQQVEKSRNELNDHVRRHLETAQINEAEARLPGIRADSAQKQTESGAMDLRGAIAGGPAAYSKVLQGLPGNIQGRFPAAASIDFSKPDQANLSVSQSAMTPSQSAADQRTREHNAEMLKDSQERIDLLRARIAMQREKMNQDASGQGNGPLRKGQGEQLIQNYEKLERSTNILRKSIESALATGKTYVNRTGQVVTMDTAAKGGDDDTKAALQRDMLDRYMQLTNDSGQASADKNRIYDRMGQPVDVGADQVNAALDADRKRVQGYYDLLQEGKTFATTPTNELPGSMKPNTVANAVRNGPPLPAPAAAPAAQGPPQASVPPVAPAASRPQSALPEAARKELKEGKVTTFHNGQSWTLRNGTPVRLDK